MIVRCDCAESHCCVAIVGRGLSVGARERKYTYNYKRYLVGVVYFHGWCVTIAFSALREVTGVYFITSF